MKHTIMMVFSVLLPAALCNAAQEAAQVREPAVRAAGQAVEARAAAAEFSMEGQAALLERLRLDMDAVDEGRVEAFAGQTAKTVSRSDFSAHAASGSYFIEYLRANLTAATPPDILASASNDVAFRLPYEVTVAGAGAQALKLTPWVQDSTGLRLHGALNAFTGDINVALSNANNPDDVSTLPQPVAIAVSAQGASSIEPKPLQIENLGQWHPVTITVPEFSGEEYEVAVSANPARPGESVRMAVLRPAVGLSSNPRSIVGWGIGQATVYLSLSGVEAPEGFEVRLDSTNGQLDSGIAVFNAANHARVSLRSSRDSGTVVEVRHPALSSEPLEIRFRPPWFFLGAAVLGGLFGAFLRGKGRQQWPKALAVGVASAIVMTLAYAVGIDLAAGLFDTAALAKSGEALVFVLGAIGALVGVQTLIPSKS